MKKVRVCYYAVAQLDDKLSSYCQAINVQVAAGVAAEQAAATARDFLSHLDEVSSQIVHGEPITEKRSTFQVLAAALPRCLDPLCMQSRPAAYHNAY